MPQETAILLRRDTRADWVSTNPVLLAGEQGLETDTGIIRTGDGTTVFTNLPGDNTLAGLRDVVISSLSDGQILQYVAASQKWVNASLPATHTQNTDTGTTQTSFAIDSGGTGLRLKNSSGELQIRNLGDSDYGNLRVKNLTVEGTSTIIHSETLEIDDNVIVLNKNAAATPTENAGIQVERGDQTDASLIWDETSDKWKAGLLGAEVEISVVGHTHSYVLLTDYEDSDVLAKIKNVDGTGSGLDADLLDGHESTYFLPAPGSPELGDTMVYNGSAWVSLPHQTKGQMLKCMGHGALPVWANIDGGSA